jgi:beta-mannosidase
MAIALTQVFTGCQTSEKKIQHNLSGENWQFQQKDSTLKGKAQVPGSIHMDLLRNKMIPDPYYRDNEKDLQWIGEKEWIYTTVFDVPNEVLSKENIELVFYGLDTYAQVYLNDSLILAADNFFREWKVEAHSLLKKQGNEMKIVFQSPVDIDKVKKKESAIPLFDDYVYTRKPSYHFGWDWGPVFITAGIWKPIIIEAWNNAQFDNIQIVQKSMSDEKAELNLIYEIESDKDITVDLLVNCPTNSTQVKQSAQLTKGLNKIPIPFVINQPKKWWPNGLGEAFLYQLNTELIVGGDIIDEIEAKTGIRTIKLVQKPDEIGKSFYFEVNGIPVFSKGANYIPQDLFLNRPTTKDYEYVIDQAVAANMNMLRVWGGGFYENDIFYDLCDEKGLLVWQDFMFACSMYPGDEHFLENVKQEAIQNVKRLRNHPSIALWCGNNENYIGWKDWRWSERYSKEDSTQLWTDYQNLYEKLLPEVISEFDTDIDYWPSSPLFGWGYPVNTEGDVHYWGIWHAQEPFENFQKPEFIGRFMSEYGFQGCPEMSTVKKFTIPEDRDIKSKVMLAHQKHRIGYPVIDKYFNWYYQQPKDFEAYLYVSQVQQAFGMGIAFEAHRRAMPHCMGTLYWQINDCYPVTSWASIDSYGNWKALHYKARQLYQEFMVSPFIENDLLNIYIISDQLQDQNADLELKLYDFNGQVLKEENITIQIKANTSHIYYSEAVKSFLGKNAQEQVVLRAIVKTDKQVIAENDFFFVLSKDLKLQKGEIKIESKKTDKGFELKLNSSTFAKDVQLSTEDGAGFFTKNFFDIIPGIPVILELEIEKENFNPNSDIAIYSLRDSYK